MAECIGVNTVDRTAEHEVAAASVGPIFIVGMPRSGTKLVRGLLNQSPYIAIPDIETDFFPFLVKWVRSHGQPRSRVDFERLLEELRKTTYFSYRDPARPFTVDSWRACFDRSDASGLFEGFVRHEVEAPRGAGVRWGDKSPAYIRHVPLLLEHFPDAQIIHIVRDVRDYCISINRAWGKDMRRAAFRWGQEVASAYRACSTAPHRCLHVRYEELLRAPHLQMQKICGFLGTPFYDAMTRLGRPAEEFGDAAGRAEIVQTNFNKFAGRLTPRQIEQIESLAFDTMHLLGLRPLYAARRRTMTSVEQQARRLKDGLQLLIRSHSRFGVAGALRFHASHRRFAD